MKLCNISGICSVINLGCIVGLVLVGLLCGVPASSPSSISPVSFVYPVMSPRVSSTFGYRIHPIRRFSAQHKGIDLAAPKDAPIRAVAGGTVVFADPYAGYGNFVVIKHGDKMTTHYGHCNVLKVSPGQKVRAGEIIATVGSSGLSTGPHLHFEVRIEGNPIDPELMIPGLASDSRG